MMKKLLTCVCGKLCTSKAGMILHASRCDVAQQAIVLDKPYYQLVETDNSNIILLRELQDFKDIAEHVAIDANTALKDGNKSAGRRARVGLLKIRDMIIPIRKKILDKISN